MQVKKYNDDSEWLDARKGKITGSKLNGLITKRGTEKKIGYYELIAERLGLSPDEEDAMERGHRLEEEAIKILGEKIGKEIEYSQEMWVRDDNENIAVSPDGVIGEDEAVEVKCLKTARHIEALLTNKIPKEYHEQVLQYFVVNDNLKKLYFVFYDPRMTVKSHFFFEVNHEEIKEEVAEMLEFEKKTIEEINKTILELSF
jgi:putative phage-type endonuclease